MTKKGSLNLCSWTDELDKHNKLGRFTYSFHIRANLYKLVKRNEYTIESSNIGLTKSLIK